MRLIDRVLRQGHLSERALVEAVVSGERPNHFDRCDLCAERAVALARWMDELKTDGLDTSDAVFTPDRLAAQQADIMRRLEQLDSPTRVIAFPAMSRAEQGESTRRRVAVSWVGIAAAAGLVIGVVSGHISTRLMQAPTQIVVNTPAQPEPASSPIDSGFLEQSYDQIPIRSIEALDDLTPRMTQTAARSGG